MKITPKYTLFLALMILVFGLHASAENVQEDLADRFPAIADVELDGVGYVARARTTTVLLASYNTATGKTGTHMLLSVDDERKEIRKIYIDCDLLLQTETDAGSAALPLGGIVATQPDPEEGFRCMIAALTAAMPLLTIDAFMAVDLNGLDVIGIDPTPLLALEDPVLLDQLGTLLLNLAKQSDSGFNELYNRLGTALITDMKSGVAMRIYSKLDRYALLETVPLPTLDLAADATITLDVPSANHVLVDALYMPLSESLAGQIAEQAQK